MPLPRLRVTHGENENIVNEKANNDLLADLRQLAKHINLAYHLEDYAARHLSNQDDRRIVRLAAGLLIRILEPIGEGLDLVMLHPTETAEGRSMSAENAELHQILMMFGDGEDQQVLARIRDTLIQCIGGDDGEIVGDLFDRLILILGLVVEEGYTPRFVVPLVDDRM